MSNGNARWRSAAAQIFPRVIAIGALLLAWWATAASGLFSESVLPSPGAVLQAFADSFVKPDPPRESILQAAQASLVRLIVGLSIGIVVGTIIGLAMATWVSVQRSVGSLMAGLQALPSISWLPHGLVVVVVEVVVVTVDDRPGVLGDVSRTLGDAAVNITLAYLATGTRLVFGADDLAQARAALGGSTR